MSAHNGFTQFVNDDDGYLRWLTQNPDGFVVNSNRVPVSSYLILHRASCKWINTPDRTNWTTTGYIKTCSNDLTVLSEWAEHEVGGSLKPCKTCQPDSGSSSSPTPRQVEPISELRTDVPITPAPSPAEASLSPGKRSLPPTISTGCPELDLAWQTYASMILNRSQILIPDTDDDLTWHAFLGHSIDMQGFRAAEFAGVDLLTRNAPKFMPLKTRGIGVPELAGLWEVPEIRQHLLWQNKDVSFAATLGVLRTHGGKIGASLADAFDHFPWRKFHWSVRALLQNSAVLQPFEFSFRRWLQYECERLGAPEFPPANFRKAVTLDGTRMALELALQKRLEQTFYMVGPAMSAYMLCDWQLWLWREGLTAVFANFKLDTFHEAFVKKLGRGVIPADEAGFVHWWHGLLPELPPRLANECIWLAVEKKLVDPWTGPMREPMATEGGTPGSTRITYPYESGFIQALREGVRPGRKTCTMVTELKSSSRRAGMKEATPLSSILMIRRSSWSSEA